MLSAASEEVSAEVSAETHTSKETIGSTVDSLQVFANTMEGAFDKLQE